MTHRMTRLGSTAREKCPCGGITWHYLTHESCGAVAVWRHNDAPDDAMWHNGGVAPDRQVQPIPRSPYVYSARQYTIVNPPSFRGNTAIKLQAGTPGALPFAAVGLLSLS